jgi:hypothetical protein
MAKFLNNLKFLLSHFELNLSIRLLFLLFIFWNNLRSRLPQDIPIEFNSYLLELFSKSIIILLLTIKKNIFPVRKLLLKIKNLILNPVVYLNERLKQMYESVAKFFCRNKSLIQSYRFIIYGFKHTNDT